MRGKITVHGVDKTKEGFERFGGKYDDLAELAFNDAIMYAADHARRYAPWTDRTGNARNSLMASASTKRSGSIVEGKFGINVYYGIYLEFKNHGKYAIIGPTVRSRIIQTRFAENMQAINSRGR